MSEHRKPAGMRHGDWIETLIHEAQREGKFDGIEHAPDPMAGVDLERDDPHWWTRKLIAREGLSATPLLIQLKQEVAELHAKLRFIPTEAEVRQCAEDLDNRLVAEELTNPPPMALKPTRVDVEALVREWRLRR